MATPATADETDIRTQIDRLIHAVRGMDLEALRSIYAPDIVTFDVQAPLRRIGAEAKLGNWMEAFRAFQPPLGYEIRDLSITVGGDVAFVHGLGRLSGTLKSGAEAGGFWVRFTACLRKLDGSWMIAHDHASVPLDLESGRTALGLQP